MRIFTAKLKQITGPPVGIAACRAVRARWIGDSAGVMTDTLWAGTFHCNEEDPSLCNPHSVTKGQQAIREFTAAMRDA